MLETYADRPLTMRLTVNRDFVHSEIGASADLRMDKVELRIRRHSQEKTSSPLRLIRVIRPLTLDIPMEEAYLLWHVQRTECGSAEFGSPTGDARPDGNEGTVYTSLLRLRGWKWIASEWGTSENIARLNTIRSQRAAENSSRARLQ